MTMFGFRQRGSNGEFEAPKKSFLRLFPIMIVQGAAMASDPKSIMHTRLEKLEPGASSLIRQTLTKLLGTVDRCRSMPIEEAFDSTVNTNVYCAIMEGAAACSLRRFNLLCREFRFTDLKTGAITEAHEGIDIQKALSTYDALVAGGKERNG